MKQLQETYRESKENGLETDITDFDIRGNPTQSKKTGGCGCSAKYEYRYDKNGKKLELAIKNDQRLFPFTYKYDTSGRIVQETVDTKMLKLNSDNEVMQDKFFYKYDASGNRIQEDYYFEQEHRYRILYRYNGNHLLIGEEYFYGDDKKPTTQTSYHYTAFDAKGNWLRRVGDVKDFGPPRQEIPEPVVIRKITYY
ncbi:hypothetical protein [Mucilaginibacter ginsenosidivorans]|uniref:RHS repeat protein n=1 Tax=Mucilaginibacter ginsenosidivorans TaxID=398053 RepID=A0A5B8UWW3_9SPHI|nr:hypothetical protein [Mucilaginibacter ginsenosidivorans]QEC62886.1 hypothetical protein FRZ54_09950 [Mucilaginibacter ginsenosidivorans]